MTFSPFSRTARSADRRRRAAAEGTGQATEPRPQAAMGISVRDLLRQKGTPYAELGLDDPALSDEQLLDAMFEHPILINRPIVVTPTGVRLCRPSEKVLDLLHESEK